MSQQRVNLLKNSARYRLHGLSARIMREEVRNILNSTESLFFLSNIKRNSTISLRGIALFTNFASKYNSMAEYSEVEKFLNEFKQKMKIYNIVFRDERSKNNETLFLLDIRPSDRRAVIEGLKVEDYSEGPLSDTLYNIADMWVFGKIIKSKEIYIKISMGLPNRNTICISFHIAEHPINYKFKNQ